MKFKNPYIGLRTFETKDKDLFFGRKKDIELIIANIFADQLLVLFSASGVGKSSIINAGIIPILKEEYDLDPIYFNNKRTIEIYTGPKILRIIN